jgi:hypothetical protein
MSFVAADAGYLDLQFIWWLKARMGLRMRRLKRYFPIFMIALMVQILAPIGVSWAFASAVSDPLAAAEICHSNLPSNGTDQGGQHQDHDANCVLCCGFSANAAPGSTPEPASLAAPYRPASGVVWQDLAPQLADSSTGSNAQARAPPSFS